MSEKSKKLLIIGIIMTVLGTVFTVFDIVVHLSEWDGAATLGTVIFAIFTLYGVGMLVMFAREKKTENKIEAVGRKIKCGGVNGRGIDVRISKNGEISFVGEFDVGELGKFNGEGVTLDFDKPDLGDGLSDEEAQEKAVEFLKNKQAEFVAHGKNLRDYFLTMMLLESRESDAEFRSSYKTAGSSLSDEECSERFESFVENDIDINAILKAYDKLGLKCDDNNVYGLIKQKLEFFDIDGLLKSIRLESLYITLTQTSIQLSDNGGAVGEVFVGAYECFDNDLVPQDWHNF